MKAVQFSRSGEPRTVAEIVELPEPPAPKAGEVVVAVEVSPIEQADLLRAEGLESFGPLPYIGGLEGMGRVLHVGSGVENVREGDRVLLPAIIGAWRQRLLVPSASLFPLPPGDPLQLGQLTVNPPTAWNLLTKFGDLSPGGWVIQNAAGSSAGRYVIGLAKYFGYRTVNVVRSLHAEADLRALGADLVIADGEDLAARVKQATAGAAIRLGFDAIGGRASARLAACLDEGGELVVFGMLSREPIVVAPQDVLFRGITVRGLFLKRWFDQATPEEIGQTYPTLATLITGGQLVSRVQATFSLDRIGEALDAVGRPGRTGRILVLPNGAVSA